MQTVGIKALQTNPGRPQQGASTAGDYLLITRHGKPIGITAAFDDGLLDLAIPQVDRRALLPGGRSQPGPGGAGVREARGGDHAAPVRVGIAIADYDLAEDLETLELLGSH